jgi:hypothetical protein
VGHAPLLNFHAENLLVEDIFALVCQKVGPGTETGWTLQALCCWLYTLAFRMPPDDMIHDLESKSAGTFRLTSVKVTSIMTVYRYYSGAREYIG